MLTHSQAPAAPARTVVLGCRGFVGSTALSHLRRLGWKAVGISSRDVDLTAEGAGGALAKALDEDDALVIVSALTPDRGRDAVTLERNVRMGRAVAEALSARPCAHVVYVSSDAVYADHVNPVRESSCASPSSLHGAMHLVRERILVEVCRTLSVPLALLRPSLLYGPGDTHNSYGPNRFLRTARTGGRIALFGDGEERRDHVFVGDVARLVLAVLERRSSGVLNAATGYSVSFREVAETVAQSVGGEIEIVGNPRQEPIMHRHFDVSSAHEAFPTFAWTRLREGLRLTAQQGT